MAYYLVVLCVTVVSAYNQHTGFYSFQHYCSVVT